MIKPNISCKEKYGLKLIVILFIPIGLVPTYLM